MLVLVVLFSSVGYMSTKISCNICQDVQIFSYGKESKFDEKTKA